MRDETWQQRTVALKERRRMTHKSGVIRGPGHAECLNDSRTQGCPCSAAGCREDTSPALTPVQPGGG